MILVSYNITKILTIGNQIYTRSMSILVFHTRSLLFFYFIYLFAGVPGIKGEPGNPAPTVQHAAFSVQRNTTHIFRHGHIIHFDHVITDIGNMFDRHFSNIIVPYDGVYLLMFDTVGQDHLSLHVNERKVISDWGQNPGSHTGSHVILTLHAGDQLWLSTDTHSTSVINFSGYMLWTGTESSRP